MGLGFIIGGLLIILVIFSVVIYNRLVGSRLMAANGWSDIDVQLKRRSDLIPQLVQTVKAYAAHETKLFESVSQRRADALGAGANPTARGTAEAALIAPVSRLLAVAEAYPDLKASQNFLDLQNALADTEDKIEHARRFYNGAVRELNTSIQTVPSNLIAGVFGFKLQSFFEIEASRATSPSVEFKS